VSRENPKVGDRVRVNWDPYGQGRTGAVGTVVDANYSSLMGWAVVVRLTNGKRHAYPAMNLDWLPGASQ